MSNTQDTTSELREKITHITGDCGCRIGDGCFWWDNPGYDTEATDAIMQLITHDYIPRAQAERDQTEARLDELEHIACHDEEIDWMVDPEQWKSEGRSKSIGLWERITELEAALNEGGKE